jgi:DNA-binding GntR family transcriptional regulator
MQGGHLVNPRLEHREPLYLQLVRHFQDKIESGAWADGHRLPPVREVASEFDVGTTTASKALRHLQAGGFVTTTNQGTFVSWGNTSTYTPRNRLRAMRGKAGRIYPPSERAEIVSAEVVRAPDRVAEAMLLDLGAEVIRRERVTLHADQPVTYSISWLPGELAEQVPALVSTDRIPGGTVKAVEAATGRKVTHDTYRECARRATPTEATRLQVQAGDPVLAGENVWFNLTEGADGEVLEFGEYVVPEGRWVTIAD